MTITPVSERMPFLRHSPTEQGATTILTISWNQKECLDLPSYPLNVITSNDRVPFSRIWQVEEMSRLTVSMGVDQRVAPFRVHRDIHTIPLPTITAFSTWPCSMDAQSWSFF